MEPPPCAAWPDSEHDLEYYKTKWYPRTVVEMEKEEAIGKLRAWKRHGMIELTAVSSGIHNFKIKSLTKWS